jgi:hypothetical protein
MPAGRFLLATLATWRVTHLLVEEDGPADVVVRLRRRAGSSWAGDLLDCFYYLLHAAPGPGYSPLKAAMLAFLARKAVPPGTGTRPQITRRRSR